MTRVEYLKSYIGSVWKDDLAVKVCVRLIDFIADSPEYQSRFLTYNAIARITDTGLPQREALIRAVSILSGRFEVLKMHFLFIDGDGNEFPLEDEDARHIIDDGFYIHPETRVKVDGIKDYMFPYYEGNRHALLSKVE
jgi:hypothetical protein